MKDRRIIVFSPHPDDETLGCGGTIARRSNEGYEVVVVVMTDGRHALRPFHIESDPTPEELARIRKDELNKAMRALTGNEEHPVFLDFEDGTLCQRKQEGERRVLEILMDPPVSEVYCTCRKDVTLDHQAASEIIRNSIKKANLRTDYYEYLVWRKYDRFGDAIDRALNSLRRDIISVDISAFLYLKEMALKEFQSQVSIMSERQKRPVIRNFKRFLRDKETFYVCGQEK